MKLIYSLAAAALVVACAPEQSQPDTTDAAAAPAAEADSTADAGSASAASDEAPASAKNIVMGVYQAFEYGDIEGVTRNFSPDIVWMEAENSPYSDRNPYTGAEEIVTGLFARLGGEWNYFNATPEEFISEGDKVVTIGRYRASYKDTGKEMDIPFVHVWTVEDGAITSFQQYTDTLAHTVVMLEEEE